MFVTVGNELLVTRINAYREIVIEIPKVKYSFLQATGN